MFLHAVPLRHTAFDSLCKASGKQGRRFPSVCVCVTGHKVSAFKGLNMLVGSVSALIGPITVFVVHMPVNVRTLETLRCEVSK